MVVVGARGARAVRVPVICAFVNRPGGLPSIPAEDADRWRRRNCVVVMPADGPGGGGCGCGCWEGGGGGM